MRTTGLALDDHVLYTIFIDEVETRNLASRDSTGRDEKMKAVRERHRRLSGDRKKASNAGYAGHVMYSEAAVAMVARKVETVAEK